MTINDIAHLLPIDADRYFQDNCYVVLSTKFPLDTKLSEFRKTLSNMKTECFPDFKALSHALRAAYQLHEIFETGDLKFPLSMAEQLLAVKKGELDFKLVLHNLEDSINVVDRLANASTLPSKVDHQVVDKFLLDLLAEVYYA